jgi:hypothetical protein
MSTPLVNWCLAGQLLVTSGHPRLEHVIAMEKKKHHVQKKGQSSTPKWAIYTILVNIQIINVGFNKCW